MLGEPLEPRRRGRTSPMISIIAALVVVLIGALFILRPWESGEEPQLALAIQATATASSVSAPITPASTDSPLPSLTPTIPTVTPTPTTTPRPQVIIHTVEAGESLSLIAQKYGVSLGTITEANGIEEDALLRIGLVLTFTLPSDAPAPEEATISQTRSAPPVTPDQKVSQGKDIAVYEVEAGDVLSSIAIQFDVSMKAIIQANDLENPEMLRVGQQLRIPLGTPTPLPPPTLIPTPTATLGPPFPAPIPLGPTDGETISGEAVLLNWGSVGLLDVDQWYLVRLWAGEWPDGVFVAEEWTKGTSWRAPADSWQPTVAFSQRFYWSVIVTLRAVGEDDGESNEKWVWEALSLESDMRTFVWNRTRTE